MPAIDGWELQKLVAAAYPHVFIIFISAFQDQQAFERALALGVFAFLYKLPGYGSERADANDRFWLVEDLEEPIIPESLIDK